MPQLNTLVLKDGKATPANHTFTPRDILNGVATVAESSGIPLGDNRVSVSLTRNSNGRIKPVTKFVFPVLQNETINGVTTPKVVRTAYAEVSFNFDQTSSEAERKDVVAMVSSALTSAAGSLVYDTSTKLEGIY